MLVQSNKFDNVDAPLSAFVPCNRGCDVPSFGASVCWHMRGLYRDLTFGFLPTQKEG
jgi:hypothetical protein